jgi:hypothetical protein
MAHIITRYNGTKVTADSFTQLAHRLLADTPYIDFEDYIPMYDDLPVAVTAAVVDWDESEARLWEVQ